MDISVDLRGTLSAFSTLIAEIKINESDSIKAEGQPILFASLTRSKAVLGLAHQGKKQETNLIMSFTMYHWLFLATTTTAPEQLLESQIISQLNFNVPRGEDCQICWMKE